MKTNLRHFSISIYMSFLVFIGRRLNYVPTLSKSLMYSNVIFKNSRPLLCGCNDEQFQEKKLISLRENVDINHCIAWPFKCYCTLFFNCKCCTRISSQHSCAHRSSHYGYGIYSQYQSCPPNENRYWEVTFDEKTIPVYMSIILAHIDFQGR